MRIIAGIHRGRRLLSPENDATRPITDRVKQSLFDVLAPRIEGARVLDLFAGTGSMGLESLSRGARNAVFFESDRSAARLLRKNIETLGVADRSSIISLDLFKWFGERNGARHSSVMSAVSRTLADLVFLDPPYRFLTEHPADLRTLARRLATDHLAPDAVVVFRHDAADELDLPPLQRSDQRSYGSMMIEFLSGNTTSNFAFKSDER
jgi:16S rRNA (guanine966-N2)-methyltransferase